MLSLSVTCICNLDRHTPICLSHSPVWRSDWGSIPEIQVFAHEKMFCARKHFFYAHKSFAPQILISHMPEDNYMNAKIFIRLCRYFWACAEIFRHAQKHLALPQKIIQCCGKLCAARRFFQIPQIFSFLARILSRLMRRFSCLKPFWDCRGAVNR